MYKGEKNTGILLMVTILFCFNLLLVTHYLYFARSKHRFYKLVGAARLSFSVSKRLSQY